MVLTRHGGATCSLTGLVRVEEVAAGPNGFTHSEEDPFLSYGLTDLGLVELLHHFTPWVRQHQLNNS